MKEIVLKHSDEISNLLGIVEIASEFAPSPINTICKLFFGQIRNLLGEIEEQRINKAVERILLGLDKDIEEGKKFNPKIVNLKQTDHRQRTTQELFEQIIRKCKDEPEEKKQVFISNIYRNLLTINSNDPLNANWGHKTIQIAQNLTYQQLILFRWINVWVCHLTFMPVKRVENKLIENSQVTGRSHGRTNYSIPHINKSPPKYDYVLTYEDYMTLFNEGFGVGANNQIYDPDRQLVIEDYKQFCNLGLIKSHSKMSQLRRERDIASNYPNEFPCDAIPTELGSYVQSLLFDKDDFTAIPSLEQDIKELESIIIDPQIAKNLEQKYNKTS